MKKTTKAITLTLAVACKLADSLPACEAWVAEHAPAKNRPDGYWVVHLNVADFGGDRFLKNAYFGRTLTQARAAAARQLRSFLARHSTSEFELSTTTGPVSCFEACRMVLKWASDTGAMSGSPLDRRVRSAIEAAVDATRTTPWLDAVVFIEGGNFMDAVMPDGGRCTLVDWDNAKDGDRIDLPDWARELLAEKDPDGLNRIDKHNASLPAEVAEDADVEDAEDDDEADLRDSRMYCRTLKDHQVRGVIEVETNRMRGLDKRSAVYKTADRLRQAARLELASRGLAE